MGHTQINNVDDGEALNGVDNGSIGSGEAKPVPVQYIGYDLCIN